jgi:hypothetical protein
VAKAEKRATKHLNNMVEIGTRRGDIENDIVKTATKKLNASKTHIATDNGYRSNQKTMFLFSHSKTFVKTSLSEVASSLYASSLIPLFSLSFKFGQYPLLQAFSYFLLDFFSYFSLEVIRLLGSSAGYLSYVDDSACLFKT